MHFPIFLTHSQYISYIDLQITLWDVGGVARCAMGAKLQWFKIAAPNQLGKAIIEFRSVNFVFTLLKCDAHKGA